jgi:hypothetical protein
MLNFERDKDDDRYWDACIYPIGSHRTVVARLWKPYRDGTVFITVLEDRMMPLSALEYLAQGSRMIQKMEYPYPDNQASRFFELGTPRPELPIPQLVVDLIVNLIKDKIDGSHTPAQS